MISIPCKSIPNRMHGRGARDTGVLFALVLVATSVAAQPMPAIKSAAPDVLQRGVTTRITISGDNIADAAQAFIAGPPGLVASIKPQPAPPTTKPAATLILDITATADAPRGPRELRLVTKNGVTKPLLLF